MKKGAPKMGKETVAIAVRMPELLWHKITESAKRSERSGNSEALSRLEKSFDGTEITGFLEKLELSDTIRMKSFGPRIDTSNLIEVITSFCVTRIVLLARHHDLNERSMVCIIETRSFTFLFDNIDLCLARRPRQLEVAEIIDAICKHELKGACFYSKSIIDRTSEMPPEKAVAFISKTAALIRIDSFDEYLDVLSVDGFDRSVFTS